MILSCYSWFKISASINKKTYREYFKSMFSTVTDFLSIFLAVLEVLRYRQVFLLGVFYFFEFATVPVKNFVYFDSSAATSSF